jgi:hypothetical protein
MASVYFSFAWVFGRAQFLIENLHLDLCNWLEVVKFVNTLHIGTVKNLRTGLVTEDQNLSRT